MQQRSAWADCCRDSDGRPLLRTDNAEWVHNGRWFATGSAPADYATSRIGNATVDWIKRVAGGDRPFFAYVAPHAPHAPSTPAPWYDHRGAGAAFNGSYPPKTPNYNFTDAKCSVSDTRCGHHWQVKSQPILTADDETAIGTWYSNVVRATPRSKRRLESGKNEVLLDHS